MNARAMLIACSLLAATSPASAEVKVVVVDSITGEGIGQTSVFLVKAGAQDVPLGTTDDNGIADDPDAQCASRLVKVEPIDDDYPTPTHMTICRPALRISLKSQSSEKLILEAATKAEAAGKHAVAAQAFSDVYATTADKTAKEAVLKNAGAYFKLAPAKAIVNDPTQGEPVASPALQGHIKTFQAAHAIDATGNLDSKTLQAMAHGTFSQNVLSAVY